VNDQKHQFLSALEDLSQTVRILRGQGLAYFGAESEVMKQFFPVFSRIEQHIAAEDLASALRQTPLFERQLGEVVGIVTDG
jgi:hypothetical protein